MTIDLAIVLALLKNALNYIKNNLDDTGSSMGAEAQGEAAATYVLDALEEKYPSSTDTERKTALRAVSGDLHAGITNITG